MHNTTHTQSQQPRLLKRLHEAATWPHAGSEMLSPVCRHLGVGWRTSLSRPVIVTVSHRSWLQCLPAHAAMHNYSKRKASERLAQKKDRVVCSVRDSDCRVRF